jgi:phosphatidylinositol-4-phosphate 3-kinase
MQYIGMQLLNAPLFVPGVTLDAVSYVQRALLPDLSSTEAAATFARFIEESLSSWFTQV